MSFNIAYCNTCVPKKVIAAGEGLSGPISHTEADVEHTDISIITVGGNFGNVLHLYGSDGLHPALEQIYKGLIS